MGHFRPVPSILKENKILEYLVLHRQQVISRDEIMDYLWESEEFVDDNTLSVNIKRLRTTLEELGIINQIETRRGLKATVGCLYVPPWGSWNVFCLPCFPASIW